MQEILNIIPKDILEYLNKYRFHLGIAFIWFWNGFASKWIRRMTKGNFLLGLAVDGFIMFLFVAIYFYHPTMGSAYSAFWLVIIFLATFRSFLDDLSNDRVDQEDPDDSIMDIIAPQEEEAETPLSLLIMIAIGLGSFLLWVGVMLLRNYELFFMHLDANSIMPIVFGTIILYLLLSFFVGVIRAIIADYREPKELDNR